MRDLSLVLCFAFCLWITLRYPFGGILTWGWLTYMNPHMAVYSFALSFPFNMAISAVTFVMLVAKKQLSKPPGGIVLYSMIFLCVWTTMTTIFAYDSSWSARYLDLTIKTFIFVFLVMSTANTKARIHGLIWIIVISVGYYGVKGGAFTIISGGSEKVFGPDNTIISDNNQLGLALVLILPLCNYLRMQLKNPLLALGMSLTMCLEVVAALGTYSRGAMIALSVVSGLLWLSSKNKIFSAVAFVIIGGAALNFMPTSFWDRMHTMHDVAEGEDTSFSGRLDAWYVATSYAIDHFPIGAGFAGPQLKPIFEYYLPGHDNHAAHSIYFQVLGEHGFFALLVYVIMLIASVVNYQWVADQAKRWPGWEWMVDLTRMARLSLISFYIGGAALSMAYYDVMLTLLGLSAVLRQLVTVHKQSLIAARHLADTSDDAALHQIPASGR